MRLLLLVALALVAPVASAAQTWNSDSALALVARAIARRSHAAADSSLRDYKAQAHGFLFFLGQLGEGLGGPPRLVKADPLELEEYWTAPGAGKPGRRARGCQHRARHRAVGQSLVAALPPGDRNPPPHDMARPASARHHPRPLADRRLPVQPRSRSLVVRG